MIDCANGIIGNSIRNSTSSQNGVHIKNCRIYNSKFNGVVIKFPTTSSGISLNKIINVDCSYSGTNNETPEIGAGSSGGATTATSGEVYVLLVTNYANNVQDITLSATGGDAETDCSIVEACVSNPGTFVRKKNGIITALPLYLCEGDSFTIESNDDYILPNDTVAGPLVAPFGDGIFTSQLMWLVYTGAPTGDDPTADPNYSANDIGYTGLANIIPAEDLAGTNVTSNALLQSLGGDCGTYYFVPVAGDDGVGVGADDNGGLHWDKDGNGCYLLGGAIPVTFACPIETAATFNCNGTTAAGNSMNIAITEGSGGYDIVNQGFGVLSGTSVANGGTLTISNLSDGQAWNVDIEDAQGCTSSVNGTFSAPTFTSTDMTAALTCPGVALGNAEATIGTTGLAGYTVEMNGTDVTGRAPNYNLDDTAGTIVTMLVIDANGCVDEENVTVGSQGHFINGAIDASSDVSCFGINDGGATVSFLPQNAAGEADGNLTGVEWLHPDGVTIIAGGTNSPQSQSDLTAGIWYVTATDDQNCDVTLAVEIGSPNQLSVSIFESSDITCFDGNDGDITLESNGGFGNVTFSWNSTNPVGPASADATTANQLTAGEYEMYVTDENGCMDSVTIELIQPDEITAWYTIKDVLCYSESTGSIIVDSVTNNAGNVSYLWNLITHPNPAVTSNIAGGLPAGTYEFKVVDENFCENQYELTIGQNDSIYWDELGFDSSICRNQIPFDNGKGQVFAAAARWAPGTGGPNFTYLWTEDATGSTTTNTTWGNRNPGFYTIIATDDHGCSLTETIYLDSLAPEAKFTIQFDQNEPQCVGPNHTEVVGFVNNSVNYAFSEDPNADTTFVWGFSVEGGDTTTQISHNALDNITYPYTNEGLYTVCLTVVENLNGCVDSTCQTIQIYDCPELIVPNVFTPGGDGVNDEFFFPNVAIVEFECTVFDRWGKEIFKYTDISQKWNGDNQKNDKPCSDGVYFYVYKAKSSNGTEFEGQGNVHLIRKE
jgi:gliding motility-associated-like protein